MAPRPVARVLRRPQPRRNYARRAAAHSLEPSSQALGLFQVCHGDGIGGCHCRFGRRRLGALINEPGCLPTKGDSRNFSIERLVLMPSMMAMASLATEGAFQWLAWASARLAAAAT